MADKAVKRLAKELKRISEEADDGMYSAGPKGDDMMEWEGTILGPEGTPYEGGIFQLELAFPPEYPFKPPKVKFLTRVYHMNVDSNGGICLGILKGDNWSPATKMPDLMKQIHQLFSEPNPSDPLEAEIAQLYSEDKDKHDATAKEMTQKYATGE